MYNVARISELEKKVERYENVFKIDENWVSIITSIIKMQTVQLKETIDRGK